MIDLSQLKNVKKVANGFSAQCPACALEGRDRSGNNLFIGEKGFHCHRYPNDKEHNKLIWKLCGQPSSPNPYTIHFKPSRTVRGRSRTVETVTKRPLISNDLEEPRTLRTVFPIIHAHMQQLFLINKETILDKESCVHIVKGIAKKPSEASESNASHSKSIQICDSGNRPMPSVVPSEFSSSSRKLAPPKNYLSQEMIEQGFRKITDWDELVAFAPQTASEIEPIKKMFDAKLREAVVQREALV